MLNERVMLRDIFQSSGNLGRSHPFEDYSKLVKFLNNGYINTDRQQLTPHSNGILARLYEFTQKRAEWNSDHIGQWIIELQDIQNGGGQLHRSMCLIAASWLIDQGFTVQSEVRRNGRHVDIATTCGTWIIECGDTSPQPIVQHLHRGSKYVAIVPFQGVDIKCLETIVFSKSPSWDDDLVQSELIIDINRPVTHGSK